MKGAQAQTNQQQNSQQNGSQIRANPVENIAVVTANQNSNPSGDMPVLDQMQDRQSVGIDGLEGIAGKFNTNTHNPADSNENAAFQSQLGQMNNQESGSAQGLVNKRTNNDAQSSNQANEQKQDQSSQAVTNQNDGSHQQISQNNLLQQM